MDKPHVRALLSEGCQAIFEKVQSADDVDTCNSYKGNEDDIELVAGDFLPQDDDEKPYRYVDDCAQYFVLGNGTV